MIFSHFRKIETPFETSEFNIEWQCYIVLFSFYRIFLLFLHFEIGGIACLDCMLSIVASHFCIGIGAWRNVSGMKVFTHVFPEWLILSLDQCNFYLFNSCHNANVLCPFCIHQEWVVKTVKILALTKGYNRFCSVGQVLNIKSSISILHN